ncbi:multiple antibiotic resistance protein [Aeromicrobium sp. SORGH_AS981]|uniref:MarC family protein n=1 Tax=Aeromicrobium sp. SORGH_AS_0981 TaxID=3041802 RepID=UPI0028578C5B|nr:MarC family protein [Aeromicrobium sp. SORGH_AS_0981]MDR6117535.1 multiple antibiotic resistance protein [Aeromicrobium sp. SORGH_AS_0981]
MTSVSVAIAALAALLPITNPLGAVAAFAALTEGQPADQVRRQAWRTGIYVAAILGVFALLGSLVLSAFGITIASLQIAGGLVVAHSGFGMIVPRETSTDAEKEHAAAKADVSFSPMALPLVAGPGAIGVVIALSARHPDPLDRVGILVAGLAIGLLIALALRFATPVVDRLGPTGIGALTRVMGFLILAIGVELFVHGVLAVLPS